MGSLAPDSISSVEATRSFSAIPCSRSSVNTAAASVEPTMAPMRRASSPEAPRISTTAAPVSAAVMTTPTVARPNAG